MVFLSLPKFIFMQALYITQVIPGPTHFNKEDCGSVFLLNIGILLQDYTVSQPEDHNLEYYRRENSKTDKLFVFAY
jgi:hypothetical protein